jgi:hypothetical protein
VEVFEPWYFCHDRPVLRGATSRVPHGGSLYLETPDADRIEKVVLVRCGSFTHAFNPDQRLVEVPFRRSKDSRDVLIATLPTNPAILIVGYYLAFVIDDAGVPSEGHFVQVRPARRSVFPVRPRWWKFLQEIIGELRRAGGLGGIGELAAEEEPPWIAALVDRIAKLERLVPEREGAPEAPGVEPRARVPEALQMGSKAAEGRHAHEEGAPAEGVKGGHEGGEGHAHGAGHGKDGWRPRRGELDPPTAPERDLAAHLAARAQGHGGHQHGGHQHGGHQHGGHQHGGHEHGQGHGAPPTEDPRD